MSINMGQLIFDQFIEIVLRLSKKLECHIDECDFDFVVRDDACHHFIDVIFLGKDKCGRCRDINIIIDTTNISCLDLHSPKWLVYLEKLARQLLNEICPRRMLVMPERLNQCRPQPPHWKPFPCKVTTTIIKKLKPVPPKPKCNVIVKEECECIPECKRVPCVPDHEVIIKYEKQKKNCCGDVTFLDRDERPNHDFAERDEQKDFNNHIWKPCGADRHETPQRANHQDWIPYSDKVDCHKQQKHHKHHDRHDNNDIWDAQPNKNDNHLKQHHKKEHCECH